MVAHGIIGGAMSKAQGGKFSQGFSAMATSAAVSMSGAFDSGFMKNTDTGQAISSAVIGGLGALAGGGNRKAFSFAAVSASVSRFASSLAETQFSSTSTGNGQDTSEIEGMLDDLMEKSDVLETDLQLASKGGKQNISVGEYNRNSNPNDVKRAADAAKQSGNNKHYKKLMGLLKVIKRGDRAVPVIIMPDEGWRHLDNAVETIIYDPSDGMSDVEWDICERKYGCI